MVRDGRHDRGYRCPCGRQRGLHRCTGVAQLLAGVPALQGQPLHTEQVAQSDSKDMTFEVWRTLAARCAYWLAQDDVQGLVRHAWHRVRWKRPLPAGQGMKPLVLACAMRPSTALAPDGPQTRLT